MYIRIIQKLLAEVVTDKPNETLPEPGEPEVTATTKWFNLSLCQFLVKNKPKNSWLTASSGPQAV